MDERSVSREEERDLERERGIVRGAAAR